MRTNSDRADAQVAIRCLVSKICADFTDGYWLLKDDEGGIPENFCTAIAKAGWLGIAMATEYGGSDLGIAEASLMMDV